MAIDLLALEPTVITRDLRNKYILLAAPYKFGKTTFMTQVPQALLLSFEPGLNARAGAYAVKINTWSDLKAVYNQLKKPEVMEKFKCVCFDTIELAAQLCQEFICARAGVQSLGEVPFGKLYKEYELEFSKTIRNITMLGYGAIFACHTEVKDIVISENESIERIQPKLDKRAFDIINSLADIIGIGVMEFDENGNRHRKLYTAETPTIRAGNRFTYFPPIIDFSYQSLLDNLSDAIEKEEQNGAHVVDRGESYYNAHDFDYNALRAEAQELWTSLVGTGDNADPEMAKRILKRVEMIFGKPTKLSEITEDQVSLYSLVIDDMKDLLAERNQ